MYRNILVPLDGSPLGEHALPLALAVARNTGAALRLVNVHTPVAAISLEGVAAMDESLEEHYLEERQKYVEGVKARLARIAPDVPAVSVLLSGLVSSTIAEYASKERVDLVVMTTHGRGALGRFWLGSVADELVRLLPMPLLLVRPGEGAPDLSAKEAPKHLMLPLDGTLLAENMVERALELAVMLGARVTLVRAVQPLPTLNFPPDGMMTTQQARAMTEHIETLQQNLRTDAREYLEKVAQRFRDRGIPVELDVQLDGRPATAILDEARARKCDLIAIETHGRHGLRRLLLGSIADKVIRGATVPVLVHRTAG